MDVQVGKPILPRAKGSRFTMRRSVQDFSPALHGCEVTFPKMLEAIDLMQQCQVFPVCLCSEAYCIDIMAQSGQNHC